MVCEQRQVTLEGVKMEVVVASQPWCWLLGSDRGLVLTWVKGLRMGCVTWLCSVTWLCVASHTCLVLWR